MRLHTNVFDWAGVHQALTDVQAQNLVAPHVDFHELEEYGSRKRTRAFEIRLGTYEKVRGDNRRWTNLGTRGANSAANGEGVYAATWDEWGWFIARLFELDPEAIFGPYDGIENFQARTKSEFILDNSVPI